MKYSRGLKIIFTICIISIFSCLGLSVNADGPLDGQIIDGSLLVGEDNASDTKPLIAEYPIEEVVPSGVYLSSGTSNISKQGAGLAYVSGATYWYKTSDTVYVELSLEQLSNGGWHTIKTHSHTTYNSDYAYTGVNFSVAHGYYYRVRGYHYAKKGSKVESTTTCTSGVYIN